MIITNLYEIFNYIEWIISIINTISIKDENIIIIFTSIGSVLTIYGIINLSNAIGRKVKDVIKVVAGGVAGNAAYDLLKEGKKNISGSKGDNKNGGNKNSGSGNGKK